VRVKYRFFQYAYTTPALLFVAIFIMIPVIYTIVLSFTNLVLTKPEPLRFVGFENYRYLFHDSNLPLIFKNTVLYVIGSVILALVIGLGIGVFLNIECKYNKFLRSIILLPWILPDVVVALEWKWMLQGEMGIINELLTRLHILERYYPWIGSPKTAPLVTIVITAWRMAPFIALMVLASLRATPIELHESAKIDGATSRSIFRYIDLPLMLPNLIVVTLLMIIWIFNLFTIVYLVTDGGPAFASEILGTYIYRIGWRSFDVSRAAALSVLALMFLLVLSLLYIFSFRKTIGGG